MERLALVSPAGGERPANDAEWQESLARGGDAAAGERVLLPPRRPGLLALPPGRGERRDDRVGLTTIGQALHARSRLIESILQPSKEAAPCYVSCASSPRTARCASA